MSKEQRYTLKLIIIGIAVFFCGGFRSRTYFHQRQIQM